ncbi:sulfotransferase [Pseudomaricurvus alcaniphilus]|uniref:sulfotransferase family protein n=1 Tax=Pseudomaricurvus alcaniphilus TaxID=1166482 RepID=UPI00140C41FC|nr:sulfotransferase [Pseudomaricurvus alcaniphilus]NHN39868.1 sulfotransferase [Pseudomaricurvus alcaniphilus]
MADLPLTAVQMLQAARAETGIDIDDSAVLPALSKLVESYNVDGQPHEEGALMLQERLLRVLKNRLRMARDFQAHPEIEEQKIDRPIFICGMARTGSTKTQKLLAASGDFNYLTYWKALNPSLISGDRSESPQARIDDADQYTRWFDARSPLTKCGHSFETHEPEEESNILEHSLITPVWYGWAPLDSYLAWLPEVGVKAQFDMLLKALKYLQWQGLADPGKRWILKSPLYSGLEHLLLDIFPDACLLMTHRTPLDTVGSGLRLLECFYQPFTERLPDPVAYVEGLKKSTQAHLDWRATQAADRFLDVPFLPLVRAPERTLRQMYQCAGEPLSDASLGRMLDWDKHNSQNKYGKHVYSLQQFGLSEAGIGRDFAEYIAFNDALEERWR